MAAVAGGVGAASATTGRRRHFRRNPNGYLEDLEFKLIQSRLPI